MSGFDDFASPSLADPGAARAYELKFLVNAPLAGQIEAAARAFLTPDPHGDPAHGGAYDVTTLYLDTLQLDTFHRSPGYARRRFRLRRYGAAPVVWLERKTRDADQVAKRRASVPEPDTAQLAQPLSLNTWPGHWFHQRLTARRLVPSCLIAYQRSALIGSGPEGPMRLTIDRHVRGSLCSQWRVSPVTTGIPVLEGQAVLEFKFHEALPAPFKLLIQGFRLSPAAVSKYRLCRGALGTLGPSANAEVSGA